MPHYTLYLSTGDSIQLCHREMTTLDYEARLACITVSTELPGPVTAKVALDDNPLYPEAVLVPGEPVNGYPHYLLTRKGKLVADIPASPEPEAGYYLLLDTAQGEQIPMTADRLSRVGPEAVKRARQYDAPGVVLRQLNRREVGRVEREHGPAGPTYHFRCRREAST